MPAAIPRALWDAVYDDPDSDAPRLALAAALTEAGDPRGEFIALQVGGAGDPAADARAAALLRKHRDAWLGPLVPHLARRTACEFRRGFPAAAEVRVRDDAEGAAALREWATFESIDFAWHPVTFVTPWMRALRKVGPLSADRAKALASAKDPWRIEALELGLRGPYLRAPDELAALASCTTLHSLRALTVNAPGGAQDDCAWVWSAPFATTLESFTWRVAANPRELRAALAAARERAPRLRELTLDPPGWWRYYALRYRFTSAEGEGGRLARMTLDHGSGWQRECALRALLALPPDALRELEVLCWPDRRPAEGALAELEALARRFTRLRALDLTKPGGAVTDPALAPREAPAWVAPGAPPPVERVAVGGVSSARFADDGETLWFASGPQLFALSTRGWALRQSVGGVPWTDLCATDWISEFAVAPGSRWCVTAGVREHALQALALDGSGHVMRSPCPPFAAHVALSPDGALAAAWGVAGKAVELFRMPDLAHVGTLKARRPVMAVAFAHGGGAAFVATWDGGIRKARVADGRYERGVAYAFGSEANGSGLEASRDGRWLAAYSPGGGVRLWSLADGAAVDLAPPGDAWSHAAAFAHDAGALYFSGPEGVFERSLGDGATRRLDAFAEPGARLLAASADGRWLALAVKGGLRVVDVRAGAVVWSFDPAPAA